ncbi:MAG: hypothetical protein ACR2QJ_14450, partial [Geminicoccaceae bacterium]
AGLLLSYHQGLPSGPAVILSAGAIWAASILLGPDRDTHVYEPTLAGGSAEDRHPHDAFGYVAESYDLATRGSAQSSSRTPPTRVLSSRSPAKPTP